MTYFIELRKPSVSKQLLNINAIESIDGLVRIALIFLMK